MPGARQRRVVAGGDRGSPGVLGIEIAQPDAQDRRLQFIQPAVHAGLGAHVTLAPSILAQRRDPRAQLRIRRRHDAAVAERAEILRGIEAEGRHVPEAADTLAGDRRAMGLGAVLDDPDPRRPGQRQDPRHIRRLPVDVDRNHRADRRDAVAAVAPPRQRRGQIVGIHAIASRVDVDQDGGRPDHFDRRDGGDRRMRHRHHRTARPDAQRAQRQRQGVGAVGDAHRVRHAEPGGELALEGLDLGTEDVPPRSQRARHRRVDLGSPGPIAGADVVLKYARAGGRGGLVHGSPYRVGIPMAKLIG
jgi:hypothetical protein